MNKIPLYIDTDAGTDDAIAILMAFSNPLYEVVGISCIGGNVPIENVTQNVLYLKEIMNQKTPIHVGAKGPLKRVLGTADFIHGKDGLGDIGIELQGRTPQSHNAIIDLAQKAELYKGALILITLGPMTNLALCLEQFPEIEDKVKMTYIMGGTYQMPGNVTPVSEFNFWADPEAAKKCIHSGLKKTIIGWDATLTGGFLTPEELNEIAQLPSQMAKNVVQMQSIKLNWLKENEQEVVCNLADPLAMAVLMRPDMVLSKGDYYCDLIIADDDEDIRGMMVVDINHLNKKLPNATVVHRANREIFKECILSIF